MRLVPVLAVAGVLAAVAAYVFWPKSLSAEEQVRAAVREMQAGADARDPGRVVAQVSERFRSPSLGDRAATSRAAAAAYKLDPEAVMGKVRGAVKDRHVSVRPAPDTMARLSALLPVAQGVAIWAALLKAADSATATGDPRTRGQLMADELTNRITDVAVTGCDDYGVPTYAATSGTTSCSSRPAFLQSKRFRS